jgi:hypothetical protein
MMAQISWPPNPSNSKAVWFSQSSTRKNELQFIHLLLCHSGNMFKCLLWVRCSAGHHSYEQDNCGSCFQRVYSLPKYSIWTQIPIWCFFMPPSSSWKPKKILVLFPPNFDISWFLEHASLFYLALIMLYRGSCLSGWLFHIFQERVLSQVLGETILYPILFSFSV